MWESSFENHQFCILISPPIDGSSLSKFFIFRTILEHSQRILKAFPSEFIRVFIRAVLGHDLKVVLRMSCRWSLESALKALNILRVLSEPRIFVN